MAKRGIRWLGVVRRVPSRGAGLPLTRAFFLGGALLLCASAGIVEWTGKAADLDCQSIWNQPDPDTRGAGMYLGVNYYGALALDPGEMVGDLTWLKSKGFTLIRVWPVICPRNK